MSAKEFLIKHFKEKYDRTELGLAEIFYDLSGEFADGNFELLFSIMEKFAEQKTKEEMIG